jgi:Nuclease-related domain
MNSRLHLRRRESVPRPALDEEAWGRTDALLRRLPAREWTVLCDVDRRHGVEHVLVGPSGVFAIASHKPPGAGARVRDGVLWLRRERDTRADRPGVAINRHVLEAAHALHREIRVRTGRGPVVHPVVVLWCEFPQRVAESSRIAFVHGRDLSAWVTHRPRELDEPGRAEVVQALQGIESAKPAMRHLPRPRLPHGPRRHAA